MNCTKRIFFVFGILTTSCQGNSKNASEAYGNSSDQDPAIHIKDEGANQYLLQRKDAELRMLGFDDTGKPMGTNSISPHWLLPKESIQLRKSKLLVTWFKDTPNGASKEEYKVKTHSNHEVFSECNGLVVFDLAKKKSQCFDKDYKKNAEKIQYIKFFEFAAQDRISVFAVASVKDTSGKTFRIVERSSDGELKIVLQTKPKKFEQFVSAIPKGILFRVETATEKDPYALPEWFADFSSGDSVATLKLNMSLPLSSTTGCFQYFSKDKTKIYSSCPTAAEAEIDIDVCTVGLDSLTKKSFNLNSKLMANDNSGFIDSYFNSEGQIFRIVHAKKNCSVSSVKIEGQVKHAAISGVTLAFIDDRLGLNFMNNLDGVTTSVVSELTVDLISLDADGSAFYRGYNPQYEFFTGVATPDGRRTLNKIPAL